jgi:mannose-1-phosphate guanylyltransferase
MSHVHAVILAGGSGTRFWPASRRQRPKQLLALAGNAQETLIAATARRIAPLVPVDRLWISTSAALVAPTLAAIPGVAASHALAEPVARNTAPCIGWAAATIARSDPDAVIAVLPADHFIGDEPAFRETLATALRAAEQGWMATIGIVPTRAETGYGYIEVGDRISPGVHSAAGFVEKPNRERAEDYVRGGKHLWNGGMFFFRASVMKSAIARHLPALAAGLDRIDAAAASGDEARVLAEVFPTLPSISIDHGVMEKAERIAVVPGSFGWNDVGSWQVTWEMADKDAAGNALPEGTIVVDAKNNLVRDLTRRADGKAGKADKRWALVGVDDLVIVETDDAVLVIPRERAQDVRAVVEALTARGEADRI